MSFGFEMIRCCIKCNAHLRAADAGESRSAFLSSDSGGRSSMDALMSMAKRTASLMVL